MRKDNRSSEEMIIYTRTGDQGKTNLYDDVGRYKDEPRIEAYGTIDELNSVLAVCKHHIEDSNMRSEIHDIQRKLFDVGAQLATEDTTILKTTITQEDVDALEYTIDRYLAYFDSPEYFIIPGDNLASAYLHLARTVCRRAERRIVTVMHHDDVSPVVLKYVNRLSDLLYTYSRFCEDNFEKVEF